MTRRQDPAGHTWLRALAGAWRAMSVAGPRCVAPLVEELEPRLLYSADFASAGLALASCTQVVEQRVLGDSSEYVNEVASQTSITEQKRELIIVDYRVPNIGDLLAGLDSERRSTDTVILGAGEDGIEQISAALAGRTDLSAIHIFSHGSIGQLQLGSTTLNSSRLDARSAEIARWGDALTGDGDILLYGCDVAAGTDGKAFVQQVASLTRADVTASDGLTGNTAMGGDWLLEYSAGDIEGKLAIGAAGQARWQGLLETLANTTVTAAPKIQAAVATNPTSGAFVVAWTSGSNQDGNQDGVFARIYDAGGTPLSGEIAVNTTTTKDQDSAAVGIAADGSFVIAWQSEDQDGSDFGIYAQRFDAAGAKVGGEILVNQFTNGYQINPSIAVAADGQFVVAWEDNRNGGDVYVRHFSNTGAALGNEILVNTNTASGQSTPAVAIDSAGNYAVAWRSDSGATGKAVFAQRFNAGDVKLGGEFRVNTYDSNDQIDPSIAMAPDGRFVIAWSSNNQDGNNYGVYAQRYAADGALAGGEFMVNTTTNDKQDAPAAAIDGTGNFVIVWESNNQDGGNLGIYAQRYFANGAVNGGEFLVNTTTTGNQELPAAAIGGAGGLVAAWQGKGVGDSKGIFWQNYLVGNNPPLAIADTASTDEDAPLSAAAPAVLGNDTDPDAGAMLTVTGILAGTTGTPTSVTPAGATVTGTYGSLLIRQDGSYTYTPNATTAQALAAGQAVSDVFSYSIKDENNAQASSTLTVTLNGLNDAPVANADSYAVAKGGTLNISASGVLGNDADVDTNPVADTLGVTQVNGSALNVGVALAGTFGTLTLNANGSLSYAPDLGNPLVSGLVGSLLDSFTYQVSDGIGGASGNALNITISGTNTAPVANDEAYTSAEDTPLTIPANGVISNDTDAEGNVLTATLVSGVSNGLLAFNGDGSFTYTPNANHNGSDSFTYQVGDGSLSSGNATVTLTITPVNDPPVGADDFGAVSQDATLTVNAAAGVLGNDTEVDLADTLTVTLIEAGSFSSAVISGTPGVLTGSYGTLTLSVDGSYSYIADGIASKALAAGQTSEDAFRYTLQDAAGEPSSATLAITITGVNDAPKLGGITATTNINDTASATPFSGVTLSDADSAQTQAVSVTLDTAAKGSFTTLNGFTDAGGGVYTFSGTASQAQTAIRGLVFTPAANRVAPGSTETSTFTITVDDGIAAAVTDNATTVVTTSVNDAPTLATPAAATYTDTAILDSFSNDSGALLGSDVDTGATLTYGIAGGTVAAGSSTLAGSLGSLSVNTATGAYTYTPNAAAINALTANATDTFGVNVSDGALTTTATYTVNLTGLNDLPTIGGVTAVTKIDDTATATPLSAFTITDGDTAQTQTVAIALDTAAKGTLSNLGGGTYTAASGAYSFSGTAAQAQTALRGLVFTPAPNRVAAGSTETTSFTISVSDGLAAPVTDNATTVVSTSVNDSPTLGGISALTTINETASATPFSGVVIGDADNPAQTQTVSIALDTAAKGTLSNLGGGTYTAASGVYGFSGTAAQAQTAIRGLVFTPAANRIAAGSSETTTFTISVSDGLAAPVTGSATTLVFSATAFFPFFVDPVSSVSQPSAVIPAAEAAVSVVEKDIVATNAADGTVSTSAGTPPQVQESTDHQSILAGNSGTLVSPSTQIYSEDRRQGSLNTMGPGMSFGEFKLDAQLLAEFATAQPSEFGTYENAGATGSRAFVQGLDQLRKDFDSESQAERQILGASIAAGTGLSIGYVMWLLRGGVLMSSLLSTLPAWRFIDPLPVLASLKDKTEESEDTDDSLESLVEGESRDTPAALEDRNHA